MRRPWLTRLVLCALVVALMPGCGTVFFLFLPRGVKVDSNPPGATVWLDNEAQDQVTPLKVAAWPQEDHVVRAVLTTEDGTELKGQTTLTRSVRVGVIVLDALFTGGLGIFVDWLTGALYHFTGRTVRINLGNYEVSPDADADSEVDRRPLRDDYPPARDDRRPLRDDFPPVRDDRRPLRDDFPPVRDDDWEESEEVRPLLDDDEPAPHVDKPTPPAVDDAETESVLEATPVDPNAEPCRICGEPRGDVIPCPSCGMD